MATRNVLVTTLIACLAPAAITAADGATLARQVAAACGLEDWDRVAHLRFTWHHLPSGRQRSYDWQPGRDRVAVTIDDATRTIAASGPADPAAEEAEVAAHQAFVNDRYWLVFPFHLAWDRDLGYQDLGYGPVPGLPDLGRTRGLAVQYPAEGGYTPGDRYVLYLGDDLVPVAWAYHPGGATEPRIVTTRGDRVERHGLDLPTRFVRADGTPFIAIEELDVVVDDATGSQ